MLPEYGSGVCCSGGWKSFVHLPLMGFSLAVAFTKDELFQADRYLLIENYFW